VDSERHLHRANTRIVKFFLNVSPEEQRKRLLARIENPEKNWKFNLEDIKERGRWKDYMKAYEACLGETSTDHAPWYAIPADDKKNARLIISKVIVETLDSLDMEYPVPDKTKARELQEIRKLLAR
jgi:polyphosphate kinase 2 (PPK2 family)